MTKTKNLKDNNGVFLFYLDKFSELIVLNFLTMVFALPVFTIGSSITAMHSVLRKIYMDEESNIIKEFCAAFRENFFKLWIIQNILVAELLALRQVE